MRIAALLMVMLLAGCSHVRINASANTSAAPVAPPPGTSVTSGSAGLRIHSHSLAAVVIAGMFIAAAIEHSREERPFPSFATFNDWFLPAPRPELAADRPVAEQDCTRPVELSGNLKCR